MENVKWANMSNGERRVYGKAYERMVMVFTVLKDNSQPACAVPGTPSWGESTRDRRAAGKIERYSWSCPLIAACLQSSYLYLISWLQSGGESLDIIVILG